jgi:predicted phosphodiesterase
MVRLFSFGTRQSKNAMPFTKAATLFLFLFLSYALPLSAQETHSPVVHSFFLVGDAGEPFVQQHHLGDVLRQQIKKTAGASTLLYLGDNVYPKGLPEVGSTSRETGEMVLTTQADWIKDLHTKGIFIPGNHDWDMWGKHGLAYVKNQQQWIDSLQNANLTFLPKGGCPGPVEIPVNEKLLLVILDTQWLLHQWEKPGKEICSAGSIEDVLTLLAEIFERNVDKRIVIAAHHPLISYGEHGGVFGWKGHLFPLTSLHPKLYLPLPIIGSLYVLYRKSFPSIQDIGHRVYKKISVAIQTFLKDHPGSIYVSGHEHALQYIRDGNVHYLISGSGSKVTQVNEKKSAKFARSVCGFIQLSQHLDGTFSVHYFEVDDAVPGGKEIFSAALQ